MKESKCSPGVSGVRMVTLCPRTVDLEGAVTSGLLGGQASTAVPQMLHCSSCRRLHLAMGMKNTVNCVYVRIRDHCVVLLHRGHVRVWPAPRCFCLLP